MSGREETDCGRWGSVTALLGRLTILGGAVETTRPLPPRWDGSSFTDGSPCDDSRRGSISKCRASTEPWSSMGVKMLRDLDGGGFGGGGD